MRKFKIGDKVRPIDNADNRDHFALRNEVHIGRVYEIGRVNPTFINLKDIGETFFTSRFELVENTSPISVGDTVRITSATMSVFANREGTVTEIADDPTDPFPYEVLLEDGTSVPLSANELTLIPPPEPDHIIVLVDGGAYAPAETPRVIRSRDGAEKVADRMAQKYGGEFAVFARVA